jgi:hypothetical protein
MPRTRLLLGAMSALVALSVIAAPVAVANGRPLKAELSGANEVPAAGDASGSARLRLNQGRHRICYRLEVSGLTLPALAAHIHAGAAGEVGDPVVMLDPPDETGVSAGCVTVARALVKAIRKHPAEYYVNVHDSVYPSGAARGQLGRWAPGRP